ncbi:hypothetical protein [Halorubrum sp. SD626R]|uniref:hypothetical protein n=1 Tax=Halorubrum sp. SD626R TaxID=1419722 RepID=UPI000B28DAEA|nr:hypothetical protein [Halorubrum sp. SD626R]TKX81077.1 hypothetical protein EXE53_07140 [Halorubrum sp. SD626R]
MPTIDITDDHRDRIEALREELTAAHAGPYASVDTEDALAYLLDLADAVDDPGRAADATALGGDEPAESEPTDDRATGESAPPFDPEHARERLESRPRRHADPDAAEEPDLYEVAAALDVTGRSDMTKAELVEATLDAAESLSADPFAWAGVELDEDESDETATGSDDSDEEGDDDEENDEATAESDDGGGADQLDAVMSLLDTHDDKWGEADGDARYEVELPDGDVETARTKDDVRALLFRNY